jgi:hypothetical protein
MNCTEAICGTECDRIPDAGDGVTFAYETDIDGQARVMPCQCDHHDAYQIGDRVTRREPYLYASGIPAGAVAKVVGIYNTQRGTDWLLVDYGHDYPQAWVLASKYRKVEAR